MKEYRIENEITGLPCGFDYESFIDGYWCETPTERVIIEVWPDDPNFHFAHLCDTHTNEVMGLLKRLGERE